MHQEEQVPAAQVEEEVESSLYIINQQGLEVVLSRMVERALRMELLGLSIMINKFIAVTSLHTVKIKVDEE